MATKKQKHAQVMQRREERLSTIRESGLKAQRLDREKRAKELRAQWQENHDKRHSWKKRIAECPICQDEIRAARRSENQEDKAG